MVERATSGHTLRRRGLIAGAAAGLLAKQTAQSVAAAYNFQGDSTAITGTSPTTLTATAGFSGGSTLFTLDARPVTGNAEGLRVLGGNNSAAILSVAKGATLPTSFYSAIYGTGRGTGSGVATGASGVLGDSTNFEGVRGFSDNYHGVYGTGGLIGVLGDTTAAAGIGVKGNATSGTGIVGAATTGLGLSVTTSGTKPVVRAVHTSFTGTPADEPDGVQGYTNSNVGAGVLGVNSSATGVGVEGTSTGASGIGVRGDSSSGIAVYGASLNGTGVYGETRAANQYGLLGTTYAANSTAIAGTCVSNGASAFSGGTTNPNAFAGVFQGNVVVSGTLAVGGGGKAAVVKHPKTGDYRLLYCIESPESWFEDFGESTLTAGRAAVALDPDFAALIPTDHYHVFLTDHDGHCHPAVTQRTASGFTVEADYELAAVKGKRASDLSGTCSWRVVAKRSDVTLGRLAKFTMPNLPLPDLTEFATPPKKP